MRHWNRFHIVTLPLLLGLVFSALVVRPAFAAGSPPPPADTPSAVTSPSSTATSDGAASAQAAGNHQAADDSGRHAALARQQAGELAVTGDPRWCPSGVVPHNGGGCSGDFPGIHDLVVGFVPTGNGTIWIQHGASAAGVEISGIVGPWVSAKNFSLTFQGGWNGHLGSTGLSKANPLDPYPLSSFAGVLFILDWGGNVTLKNMEFVSGAFDVGRDYSQLEVFTAGNITLSKVQVLNARSSNFSYAARGAYLDNTAGSGSVLVSKSLFNHNQAAGLTVLSHGSITLQSVVADLNGTQGAWISNDPAPSAHPVLISKSEFNDNATTGLLLSSDGAITLSSLTADNNGYGAAVGNDYILAAAYPVIVNGVNNFNFNRVGGLVIHSYGAIKISKTTASGNMMLGDGVSLYNASSSAPQPVTILGYLTANSNKQGGLSIVSKGAVTITHLTANGNTLQGVSVDNTAAPPLFPAPVTITGVNTFDGNGSGGSYDGLHIMSHGPVTLSNLNANNNTGNGAYVSVTGLTAPQPFILKGHNNFNFNGRGLSFGRGLSLFTDGKITASNIRANGNFSGGARLDNFINWLGSGYATNPINLGGVNVFNGNLNVGLAANGNGSIVLSHVTANSNAADGIFASAGGSSFTVTVSCSGARYNWNWNVEVSSASMILLKGYASYPLNNDQFNSIPVVKKAC